MVVFFLHEVNKISSHTFFYATYFLVSIVFLAILSTINSAATQFLGFLFMPWDVAYEKWRLFRRLGIIEAGVKN